MDRASEFISRLETILYQPVLVSGRVLSEPSADATTEPLILSGGGKGRVIRPDRVVARACGKGPNVLLWGILNDQHEGITQCADYLGFFCLDEVTVGVLSAEMKSNSNHGWLRQVENGFRLAFVIAHAADVSGVRFRYRGALVSQKVPPLRNPLLGLKHERKVLCGFDVGLLLLRGGNRVPVRSIFDSVEH